MQNKKIGPYLSNFLSRIPVPLLLLIVCILAYGLLIPWLGFYLDDWYIVLFQKVFGATDFSPFFKGDRPLFAYIYQVFVPIFRDSKFGWQLFAVIAHALAAISYWGLLRKLFPERKTLVTVATFLFAVYPGFQMHWFSVMYSQAYIINVIYFLSFILMIDSIQKKNWLLTIGAVICLIIGIVPAEDFFGLELVRPIVIFVICSRSYGTNWLKLKKTVLFWLPYLMVLTGFLIFRLAFNQAYSYPVSLLTKLNYAPIQTLLSLIGEIFWSTVDSCIIAWTNMIFLLKREILSTVSIAMLMVILIGILFSYFALKNKIEENGRPSNNRWVIILSLFAVIVSMIPFLAGSFKITLDFPNNRYLIALAPGAALFLASLIDAIVSTGRQKLVIVSLLIGFAIGSHFMVARGFMNTWKSQQDFYWQLFWRAPSIKENTVLVTEDLSFSKYFSGSSLTAPLNIIYRSGLNDHQIPYFMVLTSQQKDVIKSYLPDQPVHTYLRSFEFDGNTSSMLVFKKPADACLHVIFSDEPPSGFMKNQEDYFWQAAIPLSNPENLVFDVKNPMFPEAKYFGQENQNQWCYFYEKAELAGQLQQWQKIVDLYSEAQKAGFSPLTDTEWQPLVKAYLNLGHYAKAVEITKDIDLHNPIIIPGFCKLWREVSSVQEYSLEVDQALDVLKCP